MGTRRLVNEQEGKPSILEQINKAVRAITVGARNTPLEERRDALEFLGRHRRTTVVAHTLGDALRRFSHVMTPKEKLKIAELLGDSEAMPPLTREYVRTTLEGAIQKEISIEVGEAFRRLYSKYCE